ncbi:MAG TPA: hypothetical protein VJ866_21625 [Pyrinomonadaceae bacterium]|nr:hypothetical protein [Pyrinomonadaceae bacterium]
MRRASAPLLRERLPARFTARACAALRACAVALAVGLAAQAARAADNTVYANDYQSPFAVYTVDPATGAISAPVGNLSFSSIAMARRASDGLVFYTEYGVTNGRVNTWNPATGANANVGRLGTNIRNFPRLAFNAAGVLYGMDDQSRLYTVNTASGAATLVGTVANLPASIRGDMAFAPNGTLYATAGDNSSLYTINTGTLTAALVGATGQTNIAGNAFVNGGLLLAVESVSPDDVTTLSLSNGAASLVSSQATDLYDLAAMTKFADLSISKTSSSTFVVGSNAVYTISVTNNGPHSASGPITVKDTLPAGLSYVSATGTGWTCSNASGVVTCTSAGPVANGVTMNAITLTVAVGAAAAPSVTNTATVSGTTFDHVSTNDSSSVTKAVLTPTDLTIAKSHNGNFTRGTTGSYTLTVTNSGGVASSGTVTVTDTLPAGLTPSTQTGTGWSCSASGQTVTCTRADALAAGASYPAITLVVSVSQTAASSVTNTGAVSGGGQSNTSNDSSSDPTTVVSSSDLSLTKTVNNPNPVQGQNVTFTVTLANAGPTGATNVAVADALPAGLTFVSATPSAGSYASGTGVWSVASLASGANATLQIVALVANTGTITNTAQVTASDQPDPDSTPNNNNAAEDDQASASVGAAAPPSVGLVKSVSPAGTQSPGAQLTYTIAFSNTGGSPASAFVLTDPDTATVLKINDYMDFKVGSVTNNLGTTGLAVAVAYSNDGGATWTYTPASGAGGAPAGYDRNVTHVRWSFTGSLSQTAPNNSGSVSFIARIR